MVSLAGAGYLHPRALLMQRYMVVREIARGGQGAVYLVFDQQTGQKVAIKAVILEAIANPENYAEAIARIRREAQILSELNHPNIVKILGQFEEGGYPYVIMEYIEGQTLARAIASAGGWLLENQAVDISRQLCSALACLHSQDPPIIFRDIKPQNILVDDAYNVKLIDFGIARRYHAGAQTDSQVLGSIGYAAPEQYGSGQTDARSDIYALGVTLHTMVTGYNPASNPDPTGSLPTAQTLRPAVSSQLSAIITRAVLRNPDERFQSAAEFILALDALPKSVAPASVQPQVASNETTCWNCRQTISATARFCRHCGALQPATR